MMCTPWKDTFTDILQTMSIIMFNNVKIWNMILQITCQRKNLRTYSYRFSKY